MNVFLSIRVCAGFSLARFVQKKLCALRLWEEPYSSVRESLKMGVAVCEQWVEVCEHLSSQVWKRYSLHPWSGETHRPLGLHDLTRRLQEVGHRSCQSRISIFLHILFINVFLFQKCVCV